MTKATTIKGDAHATETDEKARGTGHTDKGEITRHADGSHDEKTHTVHTSTFWTAFVECHKNAARRTCVVDFEAWIVTADVFLGALALTHQLRHFEF